jgi:hypothetical protein
MGFFEAAASLAAFGLFLVFTAVLCIKFWRGD